MSPDKPTLWIYLAVAIALVLLGGAFAGLTIALMGQVIHNGIASQTKGSKGLISNRTRSTYKLSRRLAKDLRETMLPRYYGY